MAEKYEGRALFIGVSNNDTVEDGRAYAQEFGVPYALAHAPEVWDAFDDPFRPTTIVIGEDQTVVGRIDGPITIESLTELIEKAL